MTWFAASGDDGAADCNDSQNPGLAVDLPGSVPEVTSVGGTEYVEGTGTYWSATNNSNGASALSYIPEMTWNDSAEDGEPSASGGGASILFSKPSWQTGPGVPADNARHVPDVSLNASDDHDGLSGLHQRKPSNLRRDIGIGAFVCRADGAAESKTQLGRSGEHQSEFVFAGAIERRHLSRRHDGQQHCHGGLSAKTGELRGHSGGLLRGRGLRSDHRAWIGGRLQVGDGMEWRDRYSAAFHPTHQRHAAEQLEHRGPKRRGVFDGHRSRGQWDHALRVGLVFNRRHFVGIGRVDRIGRHGDSHAGSEWSAVAGRHRNYYGNLQQRQQRLSDGQRNGVRIGLSRHAGYHERQQRSQLQAELRARVDPKRVRIQPVARNRRAHPVCRCRFRFPEWLYW